MDEILAEYFPIGYKGVFFDVGAYEAINISNRYHFEMNGWETYCFEANTLLIDELKSKRKNVFNYAISDENKDVCEFNVVKGPWGGGSLMAGLSAINLDPDYMNKFSSEIKEILTKDDESEVTVNVFAIPIGRSDSMDRSPNCL